jgi:hypothetical protein
MTIYTIDMDATPMEVVSQSYTVANLDAFHKELDEVFIDGWYEDEADAITALQDLKEDK